MTASAPISRAQLTRQLRELGVRTGDVLLVHTSFRALRPIEGGPEGLIEALRDSVGLEGTVVMPSWASKDGEAFDPTRSVPPADLGVVAQHFWRLPGVERSSHPHAFAASGPHAAFVLQDGLPLPPHRPESPVGRVYALNGQVLLLGVNHDADTTIHLAEVMAGVRYGVTKHCTVLQNGVLKRLKYRENDHCCRRFVLMDAWLRGAGRQSEGPVGYGQARLVRSRAVVDMALQKLRGEPLIFLHSPESGCTDCDAARESVAQEDNAGEA